jgi:hypothetical protein
MDEYNLFEVNPPFQSRVVNLRIPIEAMNQIMDKKVEELREKTKREDCLKIEKTVGVIDEMDVSSLGRLVVQMEQLRSPYHQFYSLLLEKLKEAENG